MEQKLLSEIQDFLLESGLSAYRFGILAAKNGRLVERLEAGRRVWPDTASRVRTFIRDRRKAQRKGPKQ